MLEKRTFCVLTGASRGLGRAIAQEIAPKLGAGSVLAVMARTSDALDDLKQQLETSCPKVRVHVTVVDLGSKDHDWFATIFQKIVHEIHCVAGDFEQALLINNAATMETDYIRDILDKNRLDYYLSLNFTSTVMLTTHFLKLFCPQNFKHRYIVTMSSAAAAVPFKSVSMYSSCKAARVMFYKTLAAEEPDLRVLIYNPGMLDTDMQLYLRTTARDPEVKSLTTDMHINGILASPTQSAVALLSILEEDKYQPGEEIDFDPAGTEFASTYSTD